MGALSKCLLTFFEIINELYTAVGAGVLGMVVLVNHGLKSNQTVQTFSVVTITMASLLYVFQCSEKSKPSRRKVIFITGCDSGLGFSLAQHAADCGFSVVAGFLNLESQGAKEIRHSFGDSILQVQLDVTDSRSIQNAVKTIENKLLQNPRFVLHAVVNNAAVMVFGEFEWQTERLIEQQIGVNLLGTMKLTNAICPLLRQHKGRLINITSHCAQVNLPGLTVYGATKAALASWSDGLRVELGKYGVFVITFKPGSFVSESNIMAKQLQYVKEMHDSFTSEQHSFYSEYFKRYNMYLSYINTPTSLKKLEDSNVYYLFNNALLDEHPYEVYKNESFRYFIYHLLFKFCPTVIRDYLVVKFMHMPEYQVQYYSKIEDKM